MMGLLSSEVGGITGACTPGQLPRDEGQITRMRKKGKMKQRSEGSTAVGDDLFVVMQRAYTADPLRKFVQAIGASPDPCIFLEDDCKLNDMKHFCTSSDGLGIVTINATFTLGEFDVTPITYCHLLLETK